MGGCPRWTSGSTRSMRYPNSLTTSRLGKSACFQSTRSTRSDPAMDTMNSPNVRAAAAVAVVGIGCRFPGGSGVGDFWDTLLHGRDALQRRVDGNERSRLGASATAARGILQGVDGFDYELFGIPAREARMMDPQQRLLLQVSWEALEDSGIPKERLGSTTGVFVGMQSNEYGDLRARQGLRMEPHGLSGEARASAGGR